MLEVVRNGVDALEDVVEVARDRDLADGSTELAVFDQEALGASRESAGDGVEAEAEVDP